MNIVVLHIAGMIFVLKLFNISAEFFVVAVVVACFLATVPTHLKTLTNGPTKFTLNIPYQDLSPNNIPYQVISMQPKLIMTNTLTSQN